MGTFRIEIQAAGGHGVDRTKKDGETVNSGAEGVTTPDAIAKICTEALRLSGCHMESAVIIHWPGSESQVIDDLLTGKRKGNF